MFRLIIPALGGRGLASGQYPLYAHRPGAEQRFKLFRVQVVRYVRVKIFHGAATLPGKGWPTTVADDFFRYSFLVFALAGHEYPGYRLADQSALHCDRTTARRR